MSDKKFGNQSDVARRLGISRQAVAKLIKNRDRTGAPPPAVGGLYALDDFATWYKQGFKPISGPTSGIRLEKS